MTKIISHRKRDLLIQVCHLTSYGLIADFMRPAFRGPNLKKVSDLVSISLTGMIASGFRSTDLVRIYDFLDSPTSTVEEYWKSEASSRIEDFFKRAGMYDQSTEEIVWPN